MPEKVYITAVGSVCCLGSGADAFWEAICAGGCGLRPLERTDIEDCPYTVGGEVVGFDAAGFTECGASVAAQFAAQAAEQALRDFPDDLRDSLALVLASNFGPSEVMEALVDGHPVPSFPLAGGLFPQDLAYVARQTRASGQQVSISLSCSSGNAAICHGLELIRSGRADAALVGGYDSIQKINWAGLSALRVMTLGQEATPPRVQPFDLHRSGTIFSEGAGVLLLESAGLVARRGAEPLVELAGGASNNNAYHMTHPDKGGRASAEVIMMALNDARMDAGEIEHLNAHGTATRLNDAAEAQAFQAVFSERLQSIPVTSIKGVLGHAMGSASALEAIACVYTILENKIPPTLNYEAPDPECDLDVVHGAPRTAELRAVLNNSAGLGGGNAAVIMKRI